MANQHAPQDIRNVALLGNSGCGKTSLAEALLFLADATDSLGSVRERTAIMDTEPEEHRRHGSVTTSLAWLKHDGCKVNLLVVPGHPDFHFDARQVLRGADAAVLVVNAAEGVRDQDARMYRMARELGLPVSIFVNHLDHDGADADACVQELTEVLDVRPVPLQLPLGQGESFRGTRSLFHRCAYVYADDGTFTQQPLSDADADEVEGAWLQLVDNVAETDEELLEIYLETFTLSTEQVRAAFQAAFIGGSVTPVLFGAATRCIGGAALLELISWAFPSPLQRAPLAARDGDEALTITPTADGTFLAQVIHSRIDDYGAMRSLVRIFCGRPPFNGNVLNTTRHHAESIRNASWLRGRARSKATSLVCGDIIAVKKLKDTRTGDTLSSNGHSTVLDAEPRPPLPVAYIVRTPTLAAEAALQAALERACVEDAGLKLERDTITHQLRLRGTGPQHLDVTLARLRRREELDITAELPPIAYRETLRAPAAGVQGEHRRRPNGVGVYGACTLDVAPGAGRGLTFVNHVPEDDLPATFAAAIEKGVRDRMSIGFLAGYPIAGLTVELKGAGYHPLDSKEAAYHVAAARALQVAFEQQGTDLLEPVWSLEMSIPAASVPLVMKDLMARRGRVVDMDVRTQSARISAVCPEAELRRYRSEFDGITDGRGSVRIAPAGLEPVPARAVESVVSASPFRHSEAG